MMNDESRSYLKQSKIVIPSTAASTLSPSISEKPIYDIISTGCHLDFKSSIESIASKQDLGSELDQMLKSLLHMARSNVEFLS